MDSFEDSFERAASLPAVAFASVAFAAFAAGSFAVEAYQAFRPG